MWTTAWAEFERSYFWAFVNNSSMEVFSLLVEFR